MKSEKLVEAFVIRNSTPLMQMEAFTRNFNDTDRLVIDLSVTVFRLPKKERTFEQLKKELTLLFLKKLGVWGLITAVFSGIYDKSGTLEGVQKAIITKACIKMGYLNPVST